MEVERQPRLGGQATCRLQVWKFKMLMRNAVPAKEGREGGARRAEDRAGMRLPAGGKVYDCTYLSAAARGKYQPGKVESGAETQIP